LAEEAKEPKLLIDACLTRALVEHLLHHRGIDAIRVDDVLPANASDQAVARLAREQGRVVVTENAADFRRLAANDPSHPGLVVIAAGVGKARQLELGERIVDRMLADMGTGRHPRGHVYDIAADGTIRRTRLSKRGASARQAARLG
jgi:predicted nuclease of predicted toxin-antitoxin system